MADPIMIDTRAARRARSSLRAVCRYAGYLPRFIQGVMMHSASAARAYADVGLETGVTAANPHRLIVMLYDGAIEAIGDARTHVANGAIAAKGAAISRAIGIIEQGLRASLDLSRGAAIARQLDELYEYMARRLLVASLRDDAAALAEVAALLADLRSAWQTIAGSKAAEARHAA
jgi:flagellar secretion chaperone FliS